MFIAEAMVGLVIGAVIVAMVLSRPNDRDYEHWREQRDLRNRIKYGAKVLSDEDPSTVKYLPVSRAAYERDMERRQRETAEQERIIRENTPDD